jgi:hypothetical protein
MNFNFNRIQFEKRLNKLPERRVPIHTYIKWHNKKPRTKNTLLAYHATLSLAFLTSVKGMHGLYVKLRKG